MDSILISIKKLLGITEEYTHFDQDIIMHINSVLFTLKQVGVVLYKESVTGATETWDDVLGETTNLEAVKSYVYLKVRILFDPPSSSVLMESINRQINEFEWRLNVAVETPT